MTEEQKKTLEELEDLASFESLRDRYYEAQGGENYTDYTTRGKGKLVIKGPMAGVLLTAQGILPYLLERTELYNDSLLAKKDAV